MLSGRPKLLLADDSPTIQKVVSLTFGDEGMEVVTVGDGRGALRALAEDPPPDLLLADVVMPGPDGYELCERVKRDRRLGHVPVVLLVGTFEPFNEAEARRVGADTVLTKPFQSIRDLVSKVGSLLGGGPKGEEAARAPLDEPPAEDARRGADAAAPEVVREDARGADAAASSFADLGADDELIEARPADAFGAAGSDARAEAARSFDEVREPEFQAAARAEANGSAPRAAEAADFAGFEDEFEAAPARGRGAEQSVGSVMQEETFPETSFEARSASAAAADDALLDLGQVDTPATASAAEADDFVLDLDLEDETPAPHARADAPSAFAEAAHGEPQPHYAEAPTAVAEAAFAEPSHSLAAEPSFEPAADERWRDVVVQDGPQGFAFGGESREQEVSEAPRGFVEPEVVPADEPVPATVEGEFTDGSVEGDVPKAPAPEMSAAPASAPHEPTAAGFAVGEARTGVEEYPRADQLSREQIETIARRVVELMSDKVVREIAWEVVPEMAELIIKQRLDEDSSRQ